MSFQLLPDWTVLALHLKSPALQPAHSHMVCTSLPPQAYITAHCSPIALPSLSLILAPLHLLAVALVVVVLAQRRHHVGEEHNVSC